MWSLLTCFLVVMSSVINAHVSNKNKIRLISKNWQSQQNYAKIHMIEFTQNNN